MMSCFEVFKFLGVGRSFNFISEDICKIKESNGFLKYVCDGGHPGNTRYKCVNTNEYYVHKPGGENIFFYGEFCSNDPHHYQACDKRIKGKVTNNEMLCENSICSGGDNKYLHIARVLDSGGNNMCVSEICRNIAPNKNSCNEEMITLPTGKKIYSNEICDGKCQEWYCEDEGTCNGYRYGLYCTDRIDNNLLYLPPEKICNGYRYCKHGEDEENCTVTKDMENSCKHHDIRKKLVPIHNYTRCTEIDVSIKDTRRYCDLSDMIKQQTNCSDPSRVGTTCEINGYLSTVSKYLICFNVTIIACDDKIDSKCLITTSCRIHRHHMCDKMNDCVDLADEKDQICNSITKQTCKRRLGNIKSELPIPISWLKDGVKDCENGEDETADWPTCGEGKRKRYVSSKETECKNVFICRTGDPGFVELKNLCDGIETCGNENKICSVSNRPQSLAIPVPTTDKGLTKKLSYCHPGLSNLEQLINLCLTKKYTFPDEDIFGVDKKTSVILPDKKKSVITCTVSNTSTQVVLVVVSVQLVL